MQPDSNMQPAVPASDGMHAHWGWFLLLGILMVMVGITAFLAPLYSAFGAVMLLAFVLTLGGLCQIVYTIAAWKSHGFWSLMAGVLYVLVGSLLLANPAAAVTAVVLLVGILFLAGGIGRLVLGFDMPADSGRGWVIVSGIIGILLGLWVLSSPAVWTLVFLGFLIGIDLIVAGLVIFSRALSSRAPAQVMPATA
jgi:uncharacterized membrane protein HdeD (DUF308 family)